MRALPSHAVIFLLATFFAIPSTAQPVRLAIAFGDDRSEIEVRDLRTDKGEVAIQAAFAEMNAMLALAEAPGAEQALSSAAESNREQIVDRRFAALVLRAQQFCLWSNGAFGPLAGALVAHQRQLEMTGKGTDAATFRKTVRSAGCQHLRVASPERLATDSDAETGGETDAPATVALAANSWLDLRGWIRGFVVDRAIEILETHGAGNAWVELGPVRRAIGGGPRGEGWPVVLSFPGVETPVASVLLRDQAMAIALPLLPPGKRDPLPMDHRTGNEPRAGLVAVVVATPLGVDAEALATTLTIIGLHEGKMRLASLKPLPSALFLLGDGRGVPVRSDYRWLELPQVRQPPRYN